MSLYVATDTGLSLALTPDSDDWGQQLSYSEMIGDTFPLRPVSWSEKEQIFYAADYGIDGRIKGWEPLSDERNANRSDNQGYYCISTFYAKTDQNVAVSLTPAVEIAEGINGAGTYLIGTPLWDSSEIRHNNAGQGAENAVRIGIKVTRLADDISLTENVEFYIYEPNCDTHADGSNGYVNTPSLDGTDTLIPEERIIKQTASYWQEAEPVQRDVQIHTFGEFVGSTELFKLKKNEMVQIQLYIWLEGQDVDCSNKIKEAKIMANIQFKADVEGQSGLVPIE